jgi:HprK-related kinase B
VRVIHPEALLAPVDTPLALPLRFGQVPVRVLTNDADVWAGLRSYFGRHVTDADALPAAVVRLVQGPLDPGGEFVDVARGAGKKVKEAVQEVSGARYVLKRTTGVLMGLWPGHAFAAGELRANLNQAINLVNACFAEAVLREGHVLLHASAVSWNRRVAALAGPPGAGKSTSALRLIEDGYRFVTNDRLLVRPQPRAVEALGYPKMPRVNPGTLLHHPRLVSLLSDEDRERLAGLSPDALWDLEEKRDVDLEAIYGPGTVELSGDLHALVLLKWRRGGRGLATRRLEAAEALSNLPLFYKDLGAFDSDRPARASVQVERLGRFAELLGRVSVVEVTGAPDFGALTDAVGDLVAR